MDWVALRPLRRRNNCLFSVSSHRRYRGSVSVSANWFQYRWYRYQYRWKPCLQRVDGRRDARVLHRLVEREGPAVGPRPVLLRDDKRVEGGGVPLRPEAHALRVAQLATETPLTTRFNDILLYDVQFCKMSFPARLGLARLERLESPLPMLAWGVSAIFGN